MLLRESHGEAGPENAVPLGDGRRCANAVATRPPHACREQWGACVAWRGAGASGKAAWTYSGQQGTTGGSHDAGEAPTARGPDTVGAWRRRASWRGRGDNIWRPEMEVGRPRSNSPPPLERASLRGPSGPISARSAGPSGHSLIACATDALVHLPLKSVSHVARTGLPSISTLPSHTVLTRPPTQRSLTPRTTRPPSAIAGCPLNPRRF